MERVKTGEGVQFECPFCKQSVIATETPPQLFHTHPPCETFKKLSIEEYLLAVGRMQAN